MSVRQFDIQDATKRQPTEQGNISILVWMQDLETGIVQEKLIKRATLAKAFHEHRVIGSSKGRFVIYY